MATLLSRALVSRSDVARRRVAIVNHGVSDVVEAPFHDVILLILELGSHVRDLGRGDILHMEKVLVALKQALVVAN